MDSKLGRAWARDALPGPFDLYPESENAFFVRFTGAEMTFLRDDQGRVTVVVHHEAGTPDLEGRKRSAPPN